HLDAKSEYIKKIKESPLLSPIINAVLYGNDLDYCEPENNAYKTGLNLILCIRKNDAKKANDKFSEFSLRKPTRESHWIYDDFVLFALTSAVKYFDMDKSWISSVIDLAYQTCNWEGRNTKIGFRNILAGNLRSKEEFHQISIVYQWLSRQN